MSACIWCNGDVGGELFRRPVGHGKVTYSRVCDECHGRLDGLSLYDQTALIAEMPRKRRVGSKPRAIQMRKRSEWANEPHLALKAFDAVYAKCPWMLRGELPKGSTLSISPARQ